MYSRKKRDKLRRISYSHARSISSKGLASSHKIATRRGGASRGDVTTMEGTLVCVVSMEEDGAFVEDSGDRDGTNACIVEVGMIVGIVGVNVHRDMTLTMKIHLL